MSGTRARSKWVSPAWVRGLLTGWEVKIKICRALWWCWIKRVDRMPSCAPEAVDLSSESDETKQLYGLNDPVTAPYGRQCLLARRLVERGVRFVQLMSGAYVSIEDTWDAHADIVANHTKHAREVDKPIAGLITDLKRRGLLDETL